MDISTIPIESLLAIPVIAAGIYVIKRKSTKPKLVVKKTTYDRKTNKIIMHIENKKPICYSLKSAIKLSGITPEIQNVEGMALGMAIDSRPRSTLIAEDTYPIVIGPNELIEVTYTPIVPRDFLDQYSLTNLDVSINFSKYEDIQNIVTKEIFEGKLKEKINNLKKPKFGDIINTKRIGSSIVFETIIEYNPENDHLIPKMLRDFDRLEVVNNTPRYSFGNEITYSGTGTRIGNNNTIWFADLRKSYPILIEHGTEDSYSRQP